jgi:DNA-directed RNA polymerase subunit H (RpoH/RPB5)
LDTTQSPEQLRETLNNVQRHYVNFLKAELGILPEIDWDSPVYRGIVRKVGDTVAIKRDANDPNSWEIVVTQENPANVR